MKEHVGGGGYRYSSTLSLTSELKVSGWLVTSFGRFTPGKDQVKVVEEAGWARLVRKILPPTSVRTANHAIRSESLYQLSYRSPESDPTTIIILITQFT